MKNKSNNVVILEVNEINDTSGGCFCRCTPASGYGWINVAEVFSLSECERLCGQMERPVKDCR